VKQTCAGLLALALLLAGCGGSTPPPANSTAAASGGTAGPGTIIAKPVPASLLHMPLTDQYDRRITLASFRGRTILLVPFLTLCQDVCPLTTGNLLEVEYSLIADNATDVEIVELSVDPDRDNPPRLRAYAAVAHVKWDLVTAPPSELRALSTFFGFSYQKVPEDQPAGIDWLTGKPLTYDVDHSDNYFVIDPYGVERVAQDAAPDFRGIINPKLYNFLSKLGREHAAHPAQPDWTPEDVLKALSIARGRPLRVGGLA
jgi:protein SCO1/2